MQREIVVVKRLISLLHRIARIGKKFVILQITASFDSFDFYNVRREVAPPFEFSRP